MAKAITKDTHCKEVLDWDAGPQFRPCWNNSWGMHCRNCPAAARETLEQALPPYAKQTAGPW